MIIDDMSLDELCEMADLISDALYLARRYPIDGMDEDALRHQLKDVEVRIDTIAAADEAELKRAYEREAIL